MPYLLTVIALALLISGFFFSLTGQLTTLKTIILVGSTLVVAAVGSLFFAAVLHDFDEENRTIGDFIEKFLYWFLAFAFILCLAIFLVMRSMGLLPD
jgi:hypothetical protein